MRSHGLLTTLGIVAAATLLTWSLLFPSTNCRAQELTEGVYSGPSSAISQIQEGNTLTQNGSIQSTSIGNAAATSGPFQGTTGIVNINQASGNMNNQTIVTWLPISETATAPNLLGIALMQNNTLITTDAFYSVSIGPHAFQGGQGLVAINQVAGNLNNQLTSVAVSVSRQATPNTSPNIGITTGDGTALVALSNSQLTQIVGSQNNTVTNNGSLKAEARLEEGAFQDFKGVVAATLTAGNLNQVAHHVAVQVVVTP
jgi:hypothetical protein